MELRNADKLSQVARDVLEFGEESAFRQLVVSGGGTAATRARLTALSPADVLAGPAVSPEDAAALLAGLWLWHDFLDESHAISQGLHSATGSFWHAIMHRREGDFSNAKYWYARCRNHPALRDNPDALVDLVALVHRHPSDPRYAAAIERQQIEWVALFDHCLLEAGAA